MRVPLRELRREGALAFLGAVLPPQEKPVILRYRTRNGAVLRIDGCTVGAFDREHNEITLTPSAAERDLLLEVELEALPTHGMPSGPGAIWWYLKARSREEPCRNAVLRQAQDDKRQGGDDKRQGGDDKRQGGDDKRQREDDKRQREDDKRQREDDNVTLSLSKGVACIGHSHLDVAWLWTYEQTRRKAQRTFAIACELLDRDAAFVYAQSQPQLYRFVEEGDPALFEHVRARVAQGRFDADVAALWVESDCNVPSGESLLRQMLYAYEYCTQRFGVAPNIAWLPDSFGFCNTLPQLLAHAGIAYFATAKLNWNDTTKFPHPQFVWAGPDGSSVVAALIRSYDGGVYPWRVRTARRRAEPLVVGYGDGGGGVTAKMLDDVARVGRWTRPRTWFDALAAGRDTLPRHQDELYLEYHRGTYTTHHDVKAHNALLERALTECEELLSWCIAVHAPRAIVGPLVQRMRACWEIVLRNQFHDVLPGTATRPVYDDARREYAQAEELVAGAIAGAQTILPRPNRVPESGALIEPVSEDGLFVFDNGLLRAHVSASGTIVELATRGGRNVCSQANVLALYHDKPRAWEAWNIDRGYARSMRQARPAGHRLDVGALEIDFLLGRSPASMRVSLRAGEPFLRVDLDVDWRERRRLLRVENWLPVRSQNVVYGSAHGTTVRSAQVQTPQECAKFEVPGQRFAAARDEAGAGVAMLSLDSYGWSARALPKGGVHLGHSLLRGTTWPDAQADLGEHHFSYAFAPLAGRSIGALERMWLQFAHGPRVQLFSCDDEGILIVACKPAQSGEAVIVRVRECDGQQRHGQLRCGARMTQVHETDGLERPFGEQLPIEGESFPIDLAPYQLRSFRVRFTHHA